jgi:hypothetical protein
MTNYYEKLPAYQVPDGPDVSPITNALVELRKSREFDAAKAQQQSQFDVTSDQRQQTIDMAQAKADQDLKDKKLQQLGGISQYISDLPEDDPKRAELWKNVVDHHPDFAPALQKYGVDPTDHINGPKFLNAEIAGYQDPMKRRLTNAQIEMYGAHSAYYDKAGDALSTKAAASTTNAETRRIAAYGTIVDRMGPNPTEADIEREQQPGGLLNIAFGGQRITPQDWPGIYQRAQARRSSSVDEEEARAQGLNDEAIKSLKRSQVLEKTLGPPKRGYMWDLDERTGRPVQQLLAEKEDTKQKAIDTRAPFYMQNLEKARKVLGDSSMAGRAVSSMPGGSYFKPELSEANEMAGHAVVALTAIVEGQRHANAMDMRMIKFFQPAPNDTHEMQQFKLDQASQFFRTWMSAKAASNSDQYVQQRFHSALEKSYERLRAMDKAIPPASSAATPQRGWSIEKVE